MTKDEFINWGIDDGEVYLTGGLAHVGGPLIIVKAPGDTDGALATQDQYNQFEHGFGHAYADGSIMRYLSKVGDISMISTTEDLQ